ncbi:MAG: branched-chain amino acid ABC transporter permease [Rhodovibrionaceae bacterium]
MMTRLGYLLLAAWFVLLASLPFHAENYIVRIGIVIAMYSTLAYSWNVIGGFAGYPSFSTAAFFGIGAYIGGVAQHNGMPMGLAWALATLGVGFFAFSLGAILLRLRGHYFAIGSIVVVEVCRLLISSWRDVTGGGSGLNIPILKWQPDEVLAFFLWVMLVLFAVGFIINLLVDRTPLGFGLRCIRQNEEAAAMVGVNTSQYKLAGYVLSALLCGTAGAANASWVGYIDPSESFSIIMTLKVPVMVMLGGAGTLLGPALGAGGFVMLEEIFWSSYLNWNRALLGGVIVLLIFFLPGGLLKFSLKKVFARVTGFATSGAGR